MSEGQERPPWGVPPGKVFKTATNSTTNTTLVSENKVDTEITQAYTYDADGIRTGKTSTTKIYKYSTSSGGGVVASVGGASADPNASYVRYLYSTVTTTHAYVTQNGKVVRETIGSGTTAKVLDFIYDESGRPFALDHTNGAADPVTYYYVLNLQGDVIGLIDAFGEWVAKYAYNAWGEIISVTNANGVAITSGTHIATLNPLRYRGYYDTETGFYYLQSRYYDPVTHRFINADSLASTGQGFVGTNMFAYCNNSPVVLADSTGKTPASQRALYAMYTRDFVPLTSAVNKVFYFRSADQAATMAGIIANDLSAETKLEYICGIYERTALDGTIYYYYGNFIEGYYSFAEPKKVDEESENMPGKLVAYLHSHAYCVCHDCNVFSGLGMEIPWGDALVVVEKDKPLYLAAPNGTLQKLTTILTVVEISTNLPVDYTEFECP